MQQQSSSTMDAPAITDPATTPPPATSASHTASVVAPGRRHRFFEALGKMSRLDLKPWTQDHVQQACLTLADQVKADGLTPGCVVAAMNGGYFPTMIFHKRWGGGEDTLLKVKIQRKTTGPVKLALATIINKLPFGLSNWVMKQEVRLRGFLHLRRPRPADVSPNQGVVAKLRESSDVLARVTPTQPVVVVDDTIDSGSTIAIIVRSLLEVGVPRDCIKVAAMNHTFPDPLYNADYTNHLNIIYRFPWSGRKWTCPTWDEISV